MTKASASACLLLATALQLEFADVRHLSNYIFYRQVYCLSDTC